MIWMNQENEPTSDPEGTVHFISGLQFTLSRWWRAILQERGRAVRCSRPLRAPKKIGKVYDSD
jgi:hypothetical protein